ncbi:uncharacterized protein LOC105192042 [Harpegnathos saltator]|uniref:Platelet-derived growth factor (PDGF) family profile domain-containing protein n=1 Tax=Harpegnathos saltator TaxID=610380 RepID=E2B7U2_HARSA|nr:uncharacterized protein LOC105192042 [Harpegnathos saltator]EFN88235.1 hypothetical protein EAI_08761 [Harpegnathos saltator]
MGRRLTRGLFLMLILTINQMMLAPASHPSDQQHSAARRIHLMTALEASRNFTCKTPQLRAYNLRDLMQHLPSESVRQPVYIVLKRCDSHSGCCLSPDLSCAPVDSSIYYEELEIEVRSLITNSRRKVWIKVEQHGKCSCKLNTSQRDNEPPSIEIL